MKKFLVLYLSSVPAKEQMAKASPEQSKAGMELWMAWAKSAATAIVDLGAPLGSVGPGSSKVTGFSILQATSAEAIQSLMKKHPHHKAPGASIEIHEFLQMPGM
jgi:hypothetical protein